MKITCSFYIGHQDYLDFDPNLPESESKSKLAEQVYGVAAENLGDDEYEIYSPKSPDKITSTLHYSDFELSAEGFNIETAVADDEPGLPVLLYINAFFVVPDELEDEFVELEDDGVLSEQISCTLVVEGIALEFQGVPELIFD